MTAALERKLDIGFIGRFFYRREIRRQIKEIQTFISEIHNLSDAEMGELVVFSTHVRHGLEQAGHNVLDPFSLWLKNPLFMPEIIGLIQSFKKKKNDTAAAALMVWAHSVRAVTNAELLPEGKKMWIELSRGFAHVLEARDTVLLKTNTDVDISDATSIPLGFIDCK